MKVTLSIVIPTNGRPSLTHTLNSVATQLADGDEILVIRNDHAPWGHKTRNHATRRARGSHLLFIDDDDRYLQGALDLIRGWITDTPDRVHLYAMAYTDGRVVTPAWPLQIGYVSTQMMCVPRVKGKLGRWGDRYEGDYDFIATTMQLRGDQPVLHTDVVALIGPPHTYQAAA